MAAASPASYPSSHAAATLSACASVVHGTDVSHKPPAACPLHLAAQLCCTLQWYSSGLLARALACCTALGVGCGGATPQPSS